MRKRSEAETGREPMSVQPSPSPTLEACGSSPPRYLNAYYDKDRIVFVARDERGDLVLRRIRPEASCFVRQEDVDADLMRMMRESSLVSAVHREGKWLRIVWCDRDTCASASEKLEDKGVLTYEADVSPVRRYCADHRVEVARPRRVYFDIETDSRVPFSKKEQMRVLVWSLVEEDGTSHRGVLAEDTDEAEAELLADLWHTLDRFDQVLSWNGDRFDFPVIRARTRRCELPIEPGRWLWLDHLELFRRMNTMSAESGEEKQSYALGAISHAVLGEGKDDVDASKSWEMWAAGGEAREKLARYCVKDSDLMRRVEGKTGYVELLQTLCEVCGVFPNSRGADPGNQVEAFLLRMAIERGEHFASRFDKGSGGGQYRGAFVMEPTEKGIVRGVHVADFASLYPSIILSWNMSPEVRVEKPKALRGGMPVDICPSYLSHLPIVQPPNPEWACEAPLTGTLFDTRVEGLLPAAVSHVLELRKSWNAKKSAAVPGTPEWKDADRRSTAYKIAANSFYGVIGSPLSKLFARDVAEAVSQAGVWLIKETIREAEALGMRVIYGDTDSLFVAGCERGEFERFVAWCNADLYPRLLAEQGCRRNVVKLAYEKAFERVVFCCAKKYAGMYSHYKGTAATAESKPEIKGLEYKRGDATRLARAMQEEIVSLVVVKGSEEQEAIEEVLTRYREKVLDGTLEPADVVVSKTLSKSLGDYARKTKKDGSDARRPAHVEVAAVLETRGRDVGEGTKITYYCIDGASSPKAYKPAEDWENDVDRFDLWETFVWPPTERLLESAFPSRDWTGWGKVRPKKVRVAKAPGVKSTLLAPAAAPGEPAAEPQLALTFRTGRRRSTS